MSPSLAPAFNGLLFSGSNAPVRTGKPDGRDVARILKNGDVLSGAALAALGIYIVTQARGWEYFSKPRMKAL